jgi:heme A synthase
MPAEFGGGTNGKGKAFMIASAVMLEAIAAACSSPQTMEINARARADTLMKWVTIGLGLGAGLVVLGAMFETENAGPILAGGAVTGGAMWFLYKHAKVSGLDSKAPPTEHYG